MCGIIGVFRESSGSKSKKDVLQIVARMASKIRHRGPDASGMFSDSFATLAHERLSIVDVKGGKQPLIDSKTGRILIANGEIYDHLELQKLLVKKHDFKTKSDSEVLLYLYDELGPSFLEKVDGIFAFIIYDPKTKEYFVARDHIGIVPLYVGWDKEKKVYFASELKALEPYCDRYKEFPPGHYFRGSDLQSSAQFTKWYEEKWMTEVSTEEVSLTKLQDALEKSVKKQLMADVPIGVLISGGLDSSLVAAIAQKEYQKRTDGKSLHSFSIGLAESPDLKYAREVAVYIGTNHHEIVFTVEEGIAAIYDVIRHLETYDVTTIRAATPMYLMARYIKSLGIKMVMSGEGADEVFGGYLYFHMAPSAEELHQETVRKLLKLSKYDCLRANKSMAAFGVEARVPFLGKNFLNYAMSIDPIWKMCTQGRMEKDVLRRAFEGYIPESVLWRQKEQFSDGVGYSWIDSLKKLAEQRISDKMLNDAALRFPIQPPETKEAYMIREIFDELYPSKSAALTVEVGPSIACSTPMAYLWSKSFEGMADPSGRAVAVHKQAVKEV